LDKSIEIYIFKEVLFKMWTSYRNQRQVFKVGFHSIHVICTYFFAIKWQCHECHIIFPCHPHMGCIPIYGAPREMGKQCVELPCAA